MTSRGSVGLAERLRFAQFGEYELDVLARNQPFMEQALRAAIEKLYAEIQQFPEAFAVFRNDTQLARAKSAQTSHWLRLLAEAPDATYEERASRIGEAHARQNVDPHLFTASYALVLGDVIRRAFDHFPNGAENGDLIASFVKRAVLDMGEVIYAYINASESANRAKSAFLADISHELRTPLNAIIGYAEMAQEELPATDPLAKDVGHILHSAQQLLTLLNQILDLSRIEAGRVSLLIETADPAAIAVAAVELLAPAAKQNGNSLTLAVSPDLGSMQTDSDKLNQCLLNLLSNALKFTKNGQVTLSVTAEEKNPARHIVFEVSDTGIGIAADQLARLFRRYEQANRGAAKQFGGSGLGLAITKNLAELLGGEVTVASELGVGSAFTLRIPCATPGVTTASGGASIHGDDNCGHMSGSSASKSDKIAPISIR